MKISAIDERILEFCDSFDGTWEDIIKKTKEYNLPEPLFNDNDSLVFDWDRYE